MKKRYEFTGETMTLSNGVVLNRIRSLVKFYTRYRIVQKGELGGWIESYSNLSSEGNAWVGGEAMVYGDAYISGNAEVLDNARVFGNANVFGNAWIRGCPEVCDNAMIYGNALVDDAARIGGCAHIGGSALVGGYSKIGGCAHISGCAQILSYAQVENDAHYLVVGPIGSRDDFTTFYRACGANIMVVCGCFLGPVERFLEKVKETHGDSKHAKAYKAAAMLALSQIEDVNKAEGDETND